MSLADHLAEAVFSAHRQLQQQTEQTKSSLLAEREDLMLELANSSGAEDFVLRQEELEQSVSQLEIEVSALQKKIEEANEENLRERQVVRDALLRDCQRHLEATRNQQISREFYSMLDSFNQELSESGFHIASATEEECLRKLPDIREMAERTRNIAHQLALEASSKLGETSEVRSRQQAISDQQVQVRREYETILERLNGHGHSAEQGLVSEILAADKRVAQRLLREIIEPKLTDSRIEREKALFGDDPLQKLKRKMA